MNLHKNARLTPQGRALLVQRVRTDGTSQIGPYVQSMSCQQSLPHLKPARLPAFLSATLRSDIRRPKSAPTAPGRSAHGAARADGATNAQWGTASGSDDAKTYWRVGGEEQGLAGRIWAPLAMTAVEHQNGKTRSRFYRASGYHPLPAAKSSSGFRLEMTRGLLRNPSVTLAPEKNLQQNFAYSGLA